MRPSIFPAFPVRIASLIVLLIAVSVSAYMLFSNISPSNAEEVAGEEAGISGTCSMLYIGKQDSSDRQNDAQEAGAAVSGAERDGEVRPGGEETEEVFRLSMPDHQEIKGTGERGIGGEWLPVDGTYRFSGALREDGGYDVEVDCRYAPGGAEQVNPADREKWESSESGENGETDGERAESGAMDGNEDFGVGGNESPRATMTVRGVWYPAVGGESAGYTGNTAKIFGEDTTDSEE